MQFNEIVSISGMPGLYKMVAKRTDGLIVSSLTDGKSKFVSNRVHFFSPLDSITIYTETDSVELVEVFKKMDETVKENPIPTSKDSSDALKSYMEKIVPDYDKEKVYVSDIKKMVKWYSELKEHKVEFKLPEPEETPEESKEETAEKDTTTKVEKTTKAEKKKDTPKVTKAPKAKKTTQNKKQHNARNY